MSLFGFGLARVIELDLLRCEINLVSGISWSASCIIIFRYDLYAVRTYPFFFFLVFVIRIQIIQIELIFSIYQRLEIFLLAACYAYYFFTSGNPGRMTEERWY